MYYATPRADAYESAAAERPERRRVITHVRGEFRRVIRHAERSGDVIGARRLRNRWERIAADYDAWIAGDVLVAA